MTQHLNTRPLLTRTAPTRETLRRLAQADGASHELALGGHLVTFYRTTEAGGFEQAAASYDGSEWTLSSWAHRSVPRLPATATALA